MKARCIAITLLFVLINNSFSQELKWEKTPWGSDVRTYINPEADAEYRAAGDEYYEDDYPDVTYLYPYPPYSSTDRFNCHGWAWYMSEAAGGSGYSDPSPSLRVIKNRGCNMLINNNIRSSFHSPKL